MAIAEEGHVLRKGTSIGCYGFAKKGQLIS
jgi:hypothetical protein